VKWRSALAKYFVLKVCGSKLQQKIRRLYLVHQVTKTAARVSPKWPCSSRQFSEVNPSLT
jgi:hypothetical protein